MGNFEDFIAKTTSEKIILFELDYGENQRRWYNYRSGIWAWKYYTRSYIASPVLGTGNLGFDTLSGGTSGDKGEDVFHTIIGSVKADGTTYTEASTLANCVSLDSSWYFDQDDQILYFHGVNYTEPEIHTIIVGITKGMSNRGININTMYYEPRIVSDIEIEKSLDSLEWGIMSFDGASLTLSNNDGYFDNMFGNYIFGQRAVVKFGGNADRNDPMAYADYRTMFDGQVKSVSLGENTVELKLVENREKLSRMIPPNSYDQTTYSNLSSDNIGKPIQLAYGTCYKVKAMCIDEEGSTPYTFKVCDVANHSDGIRAISNAYVDGVSVPISTTSLPSATFQITGTHYTAGQRVTADITGLYASGAASIDSSADIIADLLEVFGGVAYNSTNYNTTVWGSIDTYDIGLVVDDRMAMHEVVEKVAYSNMANFVIDDDARYSWHKFDSSESADFTVDSEEILEGEWIAPEYDSEDYLTSCHVGYAKQWEPDEYRWVEDTTYETSSYAKYGKYRELKMETLLVNSTDAIELASTVMTYMNEVRMKLKNTVGIQYIDKDIGTTCNLNGDRVDSDWMGSVKCEIVGVYKTLGNNPKMTIVGREFP